jgi:glutamine amidotransferase
MKSLKNTGLDKLLPQLSQPVLGICIGMQLMCRFSEEGNVQCLGIFEANVQRLVVPDGFKVPHMGWNTVVQCSSPLTEGIADGAYFYFVHSYAPTPEKHSAALTYYGNPFSSILQNANFFGTQFHPEKSGAAGERLLANFIKL